MDGTPDAQLQRRLVARHTHRGQTTASIGYEPDLAGAAGANGCTYRQLHLPAKEVLRSTVHLLFADLTNHTAASRPATLSERALIEVFVNCRRVLAADGRAVVRLPAADTHPSLAPTSDVVVLLASAALLRLEEHLLLAPASSTYLVLAGTADPTMDDPPQRRGARLRASLRPRMERGHR